MAKVRIGFSSHFEVENEKVGIGTDSALDTLHVTGDIIADNIDISSGITTVKIYDGFVDKKTKITKDPNLNLEAHALSGEIIIEGEVTVSSGTTFTSGPDNLTVTDNFTLPGISDDKPSIGDIRFNENLGTIQVYVGGPEEPITGAGGTHSPYFPTWQSVNSYVDSGNRGRAVFGGASADSDSIHYINMASSGNSIDFGSLLAAKSELNGFSDGTRGVFANGYSSGGGRLNVIEYITIASGGDGIDFGDSTMKRNSGDSGCSSSTRGVMAGGYTYNNSPANPHNVIDYVEIQTTGDAITFGELAYERWGHGACSSPTRGVFSGGGSGPTAAQAHKEITVITIASKGNSVDFGKMSQGRYYGGASGNSVRGIFSGGYVEGSADGKKTIDYVTIASEGNAIDFGERTVGAAYQCATASSTRYFMFGGRDSVNSTPGHNVIEYVNIASTGNAMDFGDISWTDRYFAIGALSDSHGGLGGF